MAGTVISLYYMPMDIYANALQKIHSIEMFVSFMPTAPSPPTPNQSRHRNRDRETLQQRGKDIDKGEGK
jgi:hypothetical protein